MPKPLDRRHKLTSELAAEIAISALQFLASDPERLERFLALSGLGPHNLRKAAVEPTFLGAVLDYLVADEALLIAFAESAGLSPERVTAARDALVPRGDES